MYVKILKNTRHKLARVLPRCPGIRLSCFLLSFAIDRTGFLSVSASNLTGTSAKYALFMIIACLARAGIKMRKNGVNHRNTSSSSLDLGSGQSLIRRLCLSEGRRVPWVPVNQMISNLSIKTNHAWPVALHPPLNP